MCNDTEFIILDNNTVGYCSCRKQKELQRRIKSSMIDPAMKGVSFENYQVMPHNRVMYECITDYARNFDQIRGERNNSLGFLAVVGEMSIKSASITERQKLMAEHNNFGLGKTHLQSALAMYLINRGIAVLMVNDADVIAELRESQFTGEIGNKLAEIMNAELLIWDDLGKSKYKEWAQTQVYQIINHRYRHGLPIVFSSNEDSETLTEKIGGASVSRLYQMCRGRWIEVEGPDYRLQS
jgi:DNA replication protein DnaC